MSALAQCDAFAFIYDQAGDPAPDVLVVLKRVLDAGGNPILLGPKTTLTDSAGSFHFTLPEFATAFISARASALWNCPEGRAFTVPPGPSGELVPDFSLPSSTLVEPPLVYVSDVLSIPKASETQDGYLSAADFVRFEAGAGEMGITQIDTGAGITGGPITDTGTISLAPISGVGGTWSNPSSITVNAYGQIIAITSGAPDTTAPVITLVSLTGLTSVSVTITWHTNEPADSQVEYSTDLLYGTSTPLDTVPRLDHSVPISGLLANTVYNYRVKSRDIAGNPATPVTSTFTTPAISDTTAPVITLASTPVTAITETGATINWTTNESADSEVRYSVDPDISYGTPTVPPITNTPVGTSGVTTHAVSLTGLTAGTIYHYQVKSKDASGNAATPVTGTFTTLSAPAADLLTGLLAYWKLDEAADYRLDATGGGNQLTPNLVFPTTTGKFGICPQWTGAGSDLRREGDGTFAQMGTDMDYTIAGWVQIADSSADRTWVGKTGLGTDEYVGNYSASSSPPQFEFVVQGNDSTYFHRLASDVPNPALATWYFIVLWHDAGASSINIQVNNGTVYSFTLTEPPKVGVALFRVGSYAGTLNFWEGLIDEVAIWRNRILPAPERAALYGPGGAGKPFDTW
jgi:hypothetical protein